MSDIPNPNPSPSPIPSPEVVATPTETSTATPANEPPASVFAEPKSGETPAADPLDLEKLTLPEGFEKGENFDKFTAIAKEFNLSHTKTQELVSLHAKAVEAAMQSLTTSWEAKQAEWQTAVMADPEIGGAKHEEVKQTISKVLDNPALTDPEFRKAVIMTGAGNNPAVVRTMYRWAKALSEGGSINGGAPAREQANGAGNQRPSPGEAMYGPSGPHTGGPRLS